LKAVNKELVGLYWDIGKMIYEKQKELGWGKAVVETIASDLQNEFPDGRGYSASNIWFMIRLYRVYQGDKKLESLIQEIGWTHNVIILKKCKDHNESRFYIESTMKFGWTSRVLDHQISNKTYEKYLLGQTNYDEESTDNYKDQRQLAIKDHYTFDFLGLSEKHSERELEDGLIRNMQQFLLELGGDYSFMGSQYRLKVGNTEFFIDLLLFHRRLQCLVVIELKAGPFKPEYKGKLEFYLNVLNDTHKLPHENEAVGIIICKSKDRLVVEYSLMKSQNPIGIASYSTGPELPEYFKNTLPSAEQIERLLRHRAQGTGLK
jgi:predicted nuclease of restriction endonuclease-like (RecB) superfamily